MNRRDFIGAILATATAPAFVPFGSLMRPRPLAFDLGKPYADLARYLDAEYKAARVEAICRTICVPVALPVAAYWIGRDCPIAVLEPRISQLRIEVRQGETDSQAAIRARAEFFAKFSGVLYL